MFLTFQFANVTGVPRHGLGCVLGRWRAGNTKNKDFLFSAQIDILLRECNITNIKIPKRTIPSVFETKSFY
jgi:hypothetical protein